MLALVAALTAFAGVFMIVLALGSRRGDPIQSRVQGIAARYAPQEEIDLSRPFVERVVWPLLDGMANAFARLLPTSFLGRVKRLLILAGSPLPLSVFLVLMLISTLAVPGLYLALVLAAGAGLGTVQILGLIAFLLLGFYIPYFWLARRVGRRHNEILRTLPNAMDLIVTCVEAGLGLDSAFAKVAQKMPGPFAEELAQMLREIGMGRSRRDALRDVGERTGVPEIITFVNSIIHAETTGSSIGDVLRVQADQMRTRRRQRVEQRAQRIPIWMTFPLVLFLLPSLFIAILGPAAIQMWDVLQGS